MVYSNFSPSWFFGYDIVLEFAFAVISIFVAVLAYKLYKKTSQKQIMYFGISFLLIGISYLIQSVLNYLIISKANEQICKIIKVQSISSFNYIGLLIHILIMTIGYALLTYTTFRIDNKRLLWLLLIIPVLGIFFSSNAIIMFYLFSTVFLIFLSSYYISNYLKNKQSKTLLVAVAFLSLLFGSFHFLISVNHQLFYVIGHFLELIAYILILMNLYLVFKK